MVAKQALSALCSCFRGLLGPELSVWSGHSAEKFTGNGIVYCPITDDPGGKESGLNLMNGCLSRYTSCIRNVCTVRGVLYAGLGDGSKKGEIGTGSYG
ncbi:hypothetical protein [Sulfurimonas diazotrophicus]|uniref:Uncharacterized protein n=1 Tax=Sulfurimonas diazotrophicus TaxID=3131939 RepID=A0ABZ3H684_9BACT